MGIIANISNRLRSNSFGVISLASFLICVISGVALAIPFDVKNPYDSISLLMVSNPFANLFRNIHYWSAQAFFIFALIHLWEYISVGQKFKLKKQVWFRVILSIIFIFYVMLSGFILKADADSIQARRILEALLEGIPLLGSAMADFFIGPENDYQLLYVHHIATASIFIAISIYEHARMIWTRSGILLICLFIIIFLSVLFNAPLHDGLNTELKGPWYFVGFQEILHWISYPMYSMIIVLAFLIGIYAFPLIKHKAQVLTRLALKLFVILYILLTIIGYFFRGEDWKWRWEFWEAETPFTISINSGSTELEEINSIPKVLERRESCLVCHDQMQGFSPAHDPQAIGCISCHQGDPFTMSKNAAHKGMILIPGNLTDANRSCGTRECHPEITERIHKNIMTTMSGVISVDRFVFDELKLPEGYFHINDLKQTAADNHVRDLCANCHLGNKKTELGKITQISRGGGCNACHLNYSEQGLDELDKNYPLKSDTEINFHPSLDIQITNEHCFGCHSRSGRISTNYKGWHETQLDMSEVKNDDNYVILEDQRVSKKMQADVHQEAGMLCIDCHTSYETMGDGQLHEHKEEQLKVSCKDCHYSDKPFTISRTQLDLESKKIVDLRNYQQTEFLKTSKSEQALINTFIDVQGNAKMIGKSLGKLHQIKPSIAVCTEGDSHSSLDCNSCHTSWTPQCIGCHNSFEEGTETKDLLDNKMVNGAWIEYAGTYFAELPTLGVVEDSVKKVTTFTPGMVLTIDKGSYDGSNEKIFKRLFAHSSAHTTIRKGRSCKSCHNDPLAIGYGRGKLTYEIDGSKGIWKFKQRFANNKNDELPEDAWIGFMEDVKELRATRTNMRPFSIEEQQRILLVGSCLECHEEKSEIMQSSLYSFDEVLKKRTEKCILPEWFNN